MTNLNALRKTREGRHQASFSKRDHVDRHFQNFKGPGPALSGLGNLDFRRVEVASDSPNVSAQERHIDSGWRQGPGQLVPFSRGGCDRHCCVAASSIGPSMGQQAAGNIVANSFCSQQAATGSIELLAVSLVSAFLHTIDSHRFGMAQLPLVR